MSAPATLRSPAILCLGGAFVLPPTTSTTYCCLTSVQAMRTANSSTQHTTTSSTAHCKQQYTAHNNEQHCCKALWFRKWIGCARFSAVVFSTTQRVPKLKRYIFGKLLNQIFSENTLFGIGSRPVVEEPSDEERSHPCAKPKHFTCLLYTSPSPRD